MTTGYKVVAFIRSMMILVLGALPMFLLGISLATKAFFVMVAVMVVVYAYTHFSIENSKSRRRQGDAERCPYKVETKR